MVVIRVLGGALIISACTYTGFFMGNILQKRRMLLIQLRDSAMQLKALIRHERTPLPEALDKIGRGKTEPIGKMFISVSEQMLRYDGVPSGEIWRDNIYKFLGETPLSEEDRQSICRLGEGLGNLDCGMQDEILLIYMEETEHSLAVLREEIRKKTGFYRMMGVLAGAFITIILV
ncbi:MAG: stage III sporulation protein AB [Lachnospiraceae bacterium]